MYSALLATQRQKLALAPFVVLSGGSSRYDTGSHVDVDGFHLLMGLAWRAPLEKKSGSLLAGVFFESGWSDYDSRNSFNNAPSVKGKGDTDYYGGGVLGRYEASAGPGGVYGEASLRAGRTDTDFRSRDILNSSSSTTRYDSDSAYYGAHLGGGYVWNINAKASLDLSTKYIWTHENSDSVIISGDSIKFKSVDSHRWRTGARFAYAVNDYIIPYAGLYYDHEFDGKAKATANGNSIKAPDLKGGTGVGELGFTLTPSKTLPLSFDLGVQGYVGQREGVTGSLRGKYEF
jgi:outer membrane autotransporter protein